MDDSTDQQPTRRERVGGHAWVRTVGLVGGGLLAGGILAGTFSASAATTDEGTTTPPSVTQQEEGATTDGTTAPEDCPDGGTGGRGTPGERGTPPGGDEGSSTEEPAA
jgi:hypothetical protein